MMIDIHTHILPGIDDGAKDWETSLEMLAMSAKSGVRKIIATPHCIPWKKNASAETIRELCAEAEKKLLNKHGITMDIYPGNEIYYSLDIIQKLQEGAALTLADSRYVLVEFGTGSSYQVFSRAVKDFVDSGYVPVIAHAERYERLSSLARMQELKKMGAMIQMNIEAFQGGIFARRSRWPKRCLAYELVDFIGSDMHDLKKRSPIEESQMHWIRKKLNLQYRSELLSGNAQKILDDRMT